MTGQLNLLILSSEKKIIIGNFVCMMIPVVYLGHGMFSSGTTTVYRAVIFFLQISFWEGHVLSSRIEETSEKNVVHLYYYRRTLLGRGKNDDEN